MVAKEYLYELTVILEAEPFYEDGVSYIRIEVNSAREIAANLREIAGSMSNGSIQ